VLFYKRNRPIVHMQISNFRAAWRVDQFTCDQTAGSLTKLNWDEIRALGLGARNDVFDNDEEIVIDGPRGAVRGVRVDCTAEDTLDWRAEVETPSGSEAVTDVRYDG